MNELEKKVQDFIGPQGLMILKKALKQTESDLDVLNSLQLLPRAVLSWAFNITKNLSGNVQNFNIPTTEYVLSISKNEDKFDFELTKKTESIVIQKSVELPSLVLKLFEVTNLLDVIEKNFNTEANDLQKAINFLVEKFHFNNTKVTINKHETVAQCPDCGENIVLNEEKQKLCVCFSFLKKNLHVKRNISGSLTINFTDKWSKENIYLLMKTLKCKYDNYNN